MFDFTGGSFVTVSGFSGDITGSDPFGADLSFGFGSELDVQLDAEVTIDPGTITVDLPPIIPVFDPLVVVDDRAEINEDSNATVISVLANDTAENTDLLILTGVGTTENGTVELVDGQVLYTPNADFAGTDSFTYTVLDALGFTQETGTVTVEVAAVNDAPTVVAIDLGTFAEDAPAQSFDLLQGVNDIDSDAAGFSIADVTIAQTGGTVRTATPLVSIDESTGQVTLDPTLLAAELNEGDSASFQINYSVLDGDGASVANTATLAVTGLDNGIDIIPGAFIVDTLEDVIADDGFTSLREAIAFTNANADVDTIQFVVDGTIDLRDDLVISRDVRIVGNDATVDAGGRDNIFDVNDRVTVDIEDLTLANGNGNDGGAIDGRNDVTLNLIDVNFIDNAARDDGGAIAVRDRGEVNISGGTFSGNTARDDGGVIYGSNTFTLNIDGATIDGNTSGDNGGVVFARDRSDINVTGGSLSNNTASDVGGAIFVNNDSTISLTDVAVDGNSAGDEAGAFRFNDRGVVDINGGSLSGNSARLDGGAVVFDNTGRLDIDGTTVQGNTAGRNGGVAIFDDRGQVNLSNAVLDGNSAGGEGGAFAFDRDGSVTVENSTISNNTSASEGGVISLDDNGSVTIQGSIISGNSATGGSADGGVIYVDNGRANIVIENTSIIDNFAGDDGGVIATESSRGADLNVRITGTAANEIRDNEAAFDGGVIEADDDAFIFIEGVSIEGNRAGDEGGVLSVNDDADIFVSTPSDPFNGTNTGDLGDFLRAEDDLDATINGIGFDGDDIIF